MSAIDDIAAERRQLVTTLGFGDGRADDFVLRQLARAAAAYADFAGRTDDDRQRAVGGPALWPWWTLGEWRPTADRRSDLVRAGALIVAEIERLNRAAAR